MGRLFLVEFDQIAEVSFYCCQTCQAHIVLSQDYIPRMEQVREGIFSNVVNVVADESWHRRMIGYCLVEDIYCVRCNRPLGWRYAQWILPAAPNGSCLLKLARLLFWDGTLLLNADTVLDPMVDQEDQDEEDQGLQDLEDKKDQGLPDLEDER